jgi:hypothetical protein
MAFCLKGKSVAYPTNGVEGVPKVTPGAIDQVAILMAARLCLKDGGGRTAVLPPLGKSSTKACTAQSSKKGSGQKATSTALETNENTVIGNSLDSK